MIKFLLLVLMTFSVYAEEITIIQKDRKFSAKTLSIKVGDSIKFVNDDNIFHNVYSLTEGSMFDLGSYPKGQSKSVVFNTKGEVEVECSIHPEMIIYVNVK